MQLLQECIAPLEQAAERRIRQRNRLARAFLWPVLLQNGARKLVLVGEIVAIEPLLLDDMVAEGPLQFGIVLAGRCREIGLIVILGDVDRQASFEIARKEELPLRLGGLRDPARQHVAERLRRLGRRQRAAALADDAHDRAAVADIAVELL